MADQPNPESSPSMPRWVKLGGVIATFLAALMVIAHLAIDGLGGHPPSGVLGHLSPSSAADHAVQRPGP